MAAAAKLRRLASLSLAGCHELPGVCLAELTPLARCRTAAVNTHAHSQVMYHIDLPGQRCLHGRTGSRCKVLSQHQASHQACAHVLSRSCCFRLPHRSLTQLNLAGCSQLRDADLPCVGELTSLRALRLFGCSALTDEGARLSGSGASSPCCLLQSLSSAWPDQEWGVT